MTTRHLLQKIGMLAACALAAAACSEDEIISSQGFDSNVIGFGVTTATDAPDTLSRAPQAEETPVVLLGKDKQDTLYLHTSITENRSVPAPQKASTRGVPVNNGNFASVCKSFGVTAYTEDGALFINDKEVTPSGDKWTTEETYFWPEGTLHFYAHAPYNNNNITIKNSEKQISFSHTVPDEATAQPDILFAYKACSKAQSTGGTVPLEFYHALAGVKFVASDITAGTIIQSITLKNLYGAGSCTYTYNEEAPEGTEKGTFAWTPSGDKKDFKETLNVKSTGETEQAITTPQATFMMIPQDLTGVTVEVAVQTADGQNYTLTGSLAKTGKWEAGKIYTYYISTESINWEYVFTVTPSITFALGETKKTYNVTSYRQRKGDPNNKKEPVAWSAEYVSGTETDMDPEGGGTSDIAKDNVLSKFTYNGNGAASETPTPYDIEVLATTLHTTYDGDEKLQKATPKGSPTDPYDLSTHNENGGSISETTANCYVVNAPGTYKLPLVYGNAIVNGSTNSPAYQGFKDYQNNTINSPNITGADNATLVWSDGFYMFKDIKLDGNYLVFTINADFMQQANAVLAVRDNVGRIMWSWHIWVTERDVYNTTHTVDDYFDSSKKYYMMQCNLGWVDGKMVYYNQRDLDFKFTQQGSGKTDEMKVTQTGYEFDYKDVGSTYYQWGRKDPLVALRNWKSYLPEECRLHETGDPKYAYKYTPDNVTIGESIQNPNVFYVREGGSGLAANWCNENIADLWDANREHITADDDMKNITTSVKTIYDPSPRGFKVPVPRAFSVFVNGEYEADGNEKHGTLNGYLFEDEVHNKYRVYPQKDKKGEEIPFTATGQRADLSGVLEAYENGGPNMAMAGGLWSLYGVYYWTCISLNKTTAYTLVIRKDSPSGITAYSFGFNGTKTMARPVRPFKERL